MNNLITRLRRTGFLFLIGIFLIIYLGLGIIYFQQGPKQNELNEAIAKQSVIAAKPLPLADNLKAEYDLVKQALNPVTDYAVLEILVKIAKASGINVADEAGKFNIPPPSKIIEVKIGDGKYQVLPIRNIKVQGKYDDVLAFVADLDAGKTLPTMVLKKAVISQVAVMYEGAEKERRQEWRDVQAAVNAMMLENALPAIPHARNFTGEVAFDDMTVFPDALSDWTEETGGKPADPKGNKYTDGDKVGYLLFGHDIIADGRQTNLVNYLKVKTTKYYYTCEANGTVRQFDGPAVGGAIEYRGSEEALTETQATVDVDIYYRVEKPAETKPPTPQPQPKPKTGGQ